MRAVKADEIDDDNRGSSRVPFRISVKIGLSDSRKMRLQILGRCEASFLRFHGPKHSPGSRNDHHEFGFKQTHQPQPDTSPLSVQVLGLVAPLAVVKCGWL